MKGKVSFAVTILSYIHTYYYFIVQWQKLALPTTERAIKNAMQCPPFPLIHLEYYPVSNPKIPSTLSRQQQRWVSNSFPSPSYTECCDVWGMEAAEENRTKFRHRKEEEEESQHASSSSSSLGTSSLGSSTTTSWGLPLSCLDGGGGCCKQLGDGVGDKTPQGVNLHDTLCPPQVISLGPVSRGGTGVF